MNNNLNEIFGDGSKEIIEKYGLVHGLCHILGKDCPHISMNERSNSRPKFQLDPSQIEDVVNSEFS